MKNLSGADRALHVVVGGALLAIAFVGPKEPGGFLGLVPLVSGLIGHDPIYKLLGRSTAARVANSTYGRYRAREADKRSWRDKK